MEIVNLVGKIPGTNAELLAADTKPILWQSIELKLDLTRILLTEII